MDAKILELKDHYIVCGAGDVGRSVINSFLESDLKYVVIEENEKKIDDLRQLGILSIMGDATHEETLNKAGLLKAKGIVCCVGDVLG